MQVRRVRVQIETTRLRIVGTVRLPTEGYRSRTTDFLNAHDTGFIALTEAEVLGDGRAPQRHDYMAIGCRHVVAVAELEDLGVTDDELAATPAVTPAGEAPEAEAPPAPPRASAPPPALG